MSEFVKVLLGDQGTFEDVYQECPVFDDGKYCLRLVAESDAEDLLKVYSDGKAVPFFNSDNCGGDDFHYTSLERMLMYGKEASNRKQEIDRQHHTIPNQRNQRPKDKHRGNVYNLLFRHGKVRSQNMEKLKCSFPTFCKQTFPQLHKTASYAHYAQCRLLRNPYHSCLFFFSKEHAILIDNYRAVPVYLIHKADTKSQMCR